MKRTYEEAAALAKPITDAAWEAYRKGNRKALKDCAPERDKALKDAGWTYAEFDAETERRKHPKIEESEKIMKVTEKVTIRTTREKLIELTQQDLIELLVRDGQLKDLPKGAASVETYDHTSERYDELETGKPIRVVVLIEEVVVDGQPVKG